MAENEKVTFRLETIDLIALDTHAKSAGLNRTDFIKNAIREKINKAQIEQQSKREGSELQKVYQAINEMNNNIMTLSDERLKKVYDRLGVIQDLIKTKKEV